MLYGGSRYNIRTVCHVSRESISSFTSDSFVESQHMMRWFPSAYISPSFEVGVIIFSSSFSISNPSSSTPSISSQIEESSTFPKPTSRRRDISKSLRSSKSHSQVFWFRRRFSSFSSSRGRERYITGTSTMPSSFATFSLKCPPITIFIRSGWLFTIIGSTRPYFLILSLRCSICFAVCLRGLYSAGFRISVFTYTISCEISGMTLPCDIRVK